MVDQMSEKMEARVDAKLKEAYAQGRKDASEELNQCWLPTFSAAIKAKAAKLEYIDLSTLRPNGKAKESTRHTDLGEFGEATVTLTQADAKAITWLEFPKLYGSLLHLVCVEGHRTERLETMLWHYRYVLELAEQYTYESVLDYEKKLRMARPGNAVEI